MASGGWSRLAVGGMTVLLGCVSEPQMAPLTKATVTTPPPRKTDTSVTLPRALPGVLLVVNHREDGQTGFGAAVLLPGDFALTNRHVVEKRKSLSIMFYDPARPSHGGLEDEGGLRRYLFENEKALVDAWVVREDPVLDLAVIRIQGDTARYPRIPWRTEPANIGERVFAVGHPAQNVWSFTTGLVSNTHVRAIQVDAAINEGNSGGPLLDGEGRVLGINTLRALGNVQGIGYARPIAMAKSIVDGVSPNFSPVLSSPEKASASCTQAAEMGSEAWAECEDMDAYFMNIVDEGERRALKAVGSPAWLVQLLDYERTHPPRADVIRMTREQRAARIHRDDAKLRAARSALVMAIVRERTKNSSPIWAKAPPLDVQRIKEEAEFARQRFDTSRKLASEELARRTGLKQTDIFPGATVDNEVLRMGQRIDRVAKVDASHAWVAISGLNKDGSRYQYSQLWGQSGGKWREVHIPPPALAATVPSDFPPIPIEYEAAVSQMMNKLLTGWGTALTRRGAFVIPNME